MDQFESLIEDIYAAAARPELWAGVLQNLARVTNATDSLLQAMSWSHGNFMPEFLVAANIGPTEIARHGALVRDTGDPRFRAGFALQVGRTIVDQDFISRSEMEHHPYYNELLLPLDMWHVAAVPAIREHREASDLYRLFHTDQAPPGATERTGQTGVGTSRTAHDTVNPACASPANAGCVQARSVALHSCTIPA